MTAEPLDKELDDEREFDLERFLPYMLNQAAEAASRSFEATYRARYDMTRTQWRVMANLGKFGSMTARDVCDISHIEKTKVSRAVASLEERGLLARVRSESDRRAEILSLTPKGRSTFDDLGRRAMDFDRRMREQLGPEAAAELDVLLARLTFVVQSVDTDSA
jgi:DNA-binding MarR family transcriptional regulator